MKFTLLTLFPEKLKGILDSGLLAKAREKGVIDVELINPRDFAEDKHRTVDAAVFGGGPGMLLRADVLYRAWSSIENSNGGEEGDDQNGSKKSPKTILLSPQGLAFDHRLAKEFADLGEHLILICGHYEGVDQRFIDECVDLEISIGDYVLTGGELPAAIIVDAVSRFVPGVLGNEASVYEDSFNGDRLKYPQYTRPAEWRGRTVPEVLLSGNHGRIKDWREAESLRRTRARRPDLI